MMQSNRSSPPPPESHLFVCISGGFFLLRMDFFFMWMIHACVVYKVLFICLFFPPVQLYAYGVPIASY